MKALQQDQQGIASFIVCVIIMIVLTLITVGFSRQMRQEQRQVLDRQLSTQAFYAAESGVNDVIAALDAGVIGSSTDINTCNGLPASMTAGQTLDASSNIKYTCALVQNSVPDIKVDHIDENAESTSEIFPLTPENGADFSSVSIEWRDGDDNPAIGLRPNPGAATNILVPDASWGNNLGMLRIDLTPTDNLNRDNLYNRSRTFFLYPYSGGAGPTSTTNYTVDTANHNSSGALIRVPCSTTTKHCKIQLRGVPNLGSDNFVIRLASIYRPVSAVITAQTVSGTSDFVNAQVQIDVTGRANDVYRRIQVRRKSEFAATNFNSEILRPNFAIDTAGDLCKRFQLAPASPPITVIPYGAVSAPCTYP